MRAPVAVWFLPIVAAGIWLLLVLLPKIDPRRAAYASFRGRYWLIVNVTVLFLTGIQVVILGSALGWDLPIAKVLAVGIGLLLTVVGGAMGKVQPNWFFGIRTPWTLSDPEVWRQAHYFGAWVLAGVGIVIAVAALLLPVQASFVVVMAGSLGAAVVTIGYSYLVWRRRQPPRTGAPPAPGHESTQPR